MPNLFDKIFGRSESTDINSESKMDYVFPAQTEEEVSLRKTMAEFEDVHRAFVLRLDGVESALRILNGNPLAKEQQHYLEQKVFELKWCLAAELLELERDVLRHKKELERVLGVEEEPEQEVNKAAPPAEPDDSESFSDGGEVYDVPEMNVPEITLDSEGDKTSEAGEIDGQSEGFAETTEVEEPPPEDSE